MSKKSKKVRVKLIANPGSGTGTNRGQLLEQITRYFKKHGVKVDVAIAKPHEAALPIAKRAVKEGYQVIIAMGGDDTVEAIIRGIAGSKARLGIIAAGTANDLAKSLGIPADPLEACALIAEGHVRKLDLGEVRVGKGKKLPFFELVTVGIGAAVYEDALHASKGRLSSLKGAIQTVLAHEANPKITVMMDDDSSVTVKTMMAVVANVPLIGPNMLVAPDASLDDGLFDISLYPEFSKAEALAYFAKVMNQRTAEDGTIQRYRASKIKIKSSPKLEILADGILLGKGTVRIKVLPGALRVIAPEVGQGAEKPAEMTGADLPAPLAPAVTAKEAENNGSKSLPEPTPKN